MRAGCAQRFNLCCIAFENDHALAAEAERRFLGQTVRDQNHRVFSLAAVLRQRKRGGAIACNHDVTRSAKVEDARQRAPELPRKREQQTHNRRR